jgi:hypothetical protein
LVLCRAWQALRRQAGGRTDRGGRKRDRGPSWFGGEGEAPPGQAREHPRRRGKMLHSVARRGTTPIARTGSFAMCYALSGLPLLSRQRPRANDSPYVGAPVRRCAGTSVSRWLCTAKRLDIVAQGQRSTTLGNGTRAIPNPEGVAHVDAIVPVVRKGGQAREWER